MSLSALAVLWWTESQVLCRAPLFNQLREYLLTVFQIYPHGFMFKCCFLVFHPGHRIFQVPLNSGTSGLRQTSFIYFRSELAEPCQGFCVLHDVQAPGVFSIPLRLVTPHSTWGSTLDPISLGFHEKILHSACEQGCCKRGGAGPRARPPGQASTLLRCRVNASVLV